MAATPRRAPAIGLTHPTVVPTNYRPPSAAERAPERGTEGS